MFGERGGGVGGKIGPRGAREGRHKKLGKKKKGPLRTSPQMRRGKSRSRDSLCTGRKKKCGELRPKREKGRRWKNYLISLCWAREEKRRAGHSGHTWAR